MDWSYIACFIDTDGCLGINKNLVRIFFVNTNEGCLRKMQKFMRVGKIRSRLPQSNELAKKRIYKLEVNKQKDCKILLENTIDKMNIKRNKAQECLEFLKEKLKTMRLSHRPQNRCIDCNKEISYRAQRCKSCSNRNRTINKIYSELNHHG